MPPVLLIVVGIVALLIGSELVVRAATRLAERLHIPPMIVGLTVVSIGTSTPELAVGVRSGASGVGELAVGTVAGTNVVNILLILGLSALIRPLAIKRRTMRLDLPFMAFTAILIVLLALDGRLSWLDGVVLLALAVIYTGIVLWIGLRKRGPRRRSGGAGGGEDPQWQDTPRPGWKGVTVDSLAVRPRLHHRPGDPSLGGRPVRPRLPRLPGLPDLHGAVSRGTYLTSLRATRQKPITSGSRIHSALEVPSWAHCSPVSQLVPSSWLCVVIRSNHAEFSRSHAVDMNSSGVRPGTRK